MTIELNGERFELGPAATIVDLVGEQRKGVAVAVDGEVVPRSEWGVTELTEGQRVEVVGAIQGG